MFEFQINSKMRNAWIVLTLVWLLLVSVGFIDSELPWSIKAVHIATAVFYPGILICAVRAVRGPNADWKDLAPEAKKLSTFGYVWRASVGSCSSIAILGLLRAVMPFRVNQTKLATPELVAWFIFCTIIALVGIWLIFSRNRREQFAYLVSGIRGY